MYPLLFGSIPAYFLSWVVALLTGLWIGTRWAVHAGLPATRSFVAILALALSIVAGSKLLYLAEAYWFSAADYVPQAVRTSFHGFRIPGGILLLAATMPLVCGALRLPWRRFGDLVMPLVALALVFIRFGCFLNGCCFGKVSSVPWAVSFPPGSWVFWYHKTHGWLPPGAETALPVHPLQLYFLIAAIAGFGVLLLQGRDARYPGYLQLLFYAIFFGSTAALELFRENSLTLNNWLAATVAVISVGMLMSRRMCLGQRVDPTLVRWTAEPRR